MFTPACARHRFQPAEVIKGAYTFSLRLTVKAKLRKSSFADGERSLLAAYRSAVEKIGGVVIEEVNAPFAIPSVTYIAPGGISLYNDFRSYKTADQADEARRKIAAGIEENGGTVLSSRVFSAKSGAIYLAAFVTGNRLPVYVDSGRYPSNEAAQAACTRAAAAAAKRGIVTLNQYVSQDRDGYSFRLGLLLPAGMRLSDEIYGDDPSFSTAAEAQACLEDMRKRLAQESDWVILDSHVFVSGPSQSSADTFFIPRIECLKLVPATATIEPKPTILPRRGPVLLPRKRSIAKDG